MNKYKLAAAIVSDSDIWKHEKEVQEALEKLLNAFTEKMRIVYDRYAPEHSWSTKYLCEDKFRECVIEAVKLLLVSLHIEYSALRKEGFDPDEAAEIALCSVFREEQLEVRDMVLDLLRDALELVRGESCD